MTNDAVAVPPSDPLSPCHIVVAPRIHVAAFYDLDVQQQQAVWQLVEEIRKRIAASVKVTGFHIGFVDHHPGQHTHVHVVPRDPSEHISLPDGIEWVGVDLEC